MTRTLLITAGCVNVGLGVAGIFLPLLPTTPFLLLAAACFAKGSPQWHQWLMTHPRFGPYLDSYRGKTGMPFRAKLATLAILWITIGGSIWWIDRPFITRFLLGVVVGVTGLILYLTRTRRP